MKKRINNYYTYLFVLTVLLFAISIGGLKSQELSRISGVVNEEGTGGPLPGATVYIKDILLGTITNLNGEFTILKVPAGKHTLIVSFIGYGPDSVIVEVRNGQDLKQDFKLGMGNMGIEEVVVTVQARGQLGAINLQRSSDQMKNVVSAEKIQEVPDANAAESIARLPGIALQRSGGEGSNVIIRGLSPEYSKITLNGISLPSTSVGSFSNAGSRTTDLSMISSESLSGIEVFKSLTPDMEGDAIAGTVNLQIAKARNNPNRFVRAYNMYNVDAKDLGQYKAMGLWSQRILNNKLGLQASINSEFRNRSSDGLEASYALSAPKEGEPTPLKLTKSTVIDVEEYRKRVGANLVMDYDIGNWEFMLSNFYNQTQRDIGNRESVYDVSDGLGYAYISNPSRNLDMLTNTLNAKYTMNLFKIDWSLSRTNVKNSNWNDNELNFLQTNNSLPTNADFEKLGPAKLINMIQPDSTQSVYDLTRNSAQMQETSYVADMNITVPFKLGNLITGDFKFGGKYRSSNRDHSSEYYIWAARYLENPHTPISYFYDQEYDQGNFLNGETNIDIILNPQKTNEYFEEKASNLILNDWTYKEFHTKDHIGAGYVMTKLNIGKAVTFIPGVRYEQFDGEYTGEYRIAVSPDDGERTPKTSNIVHKDWLPMFNLKVTPNDWFDIRMSVTKTLIRPGYQQMLPNLDVSVQALNRPVNQGNPDLQPTRSWNYDTYLTFYNEYMGFFTVGGFYKKMDGVIVRTTRFIETAEKADGLGLPETFSVYKGNSLYYVNRQLTRYENGKESDVKGIELEWQTNMRYLPVPFNGIVLSVNYTRLWSNTNYPNFKSYTTLDRTTKPPKVVTEYVNSEREGRVVGQAEKLMNFSFGYDLKGFSARVSTTYQGESLRSVGSQIELDTWNEAFIRWDVSLKQKAGKYLTFFVNGANLNNQSDGTYNAIDGRQSYSHYYGPSYDIGLQVKF